MDSSRELSRTIAESAVGHETELLVLRDGTEKEFAIELGKRPETMVAAQSPEVQKKNPLGIALSNLTPEIIQQFRLQAEKASWWSVWNRTARARKLCSAWRSYQGNQPPGNERRGSISERDRKIQKGRDHFTLYFKEQQGGSWPSH